MSKKKITKPPVKKTTKPRTALTKSKVPAKAKPVKRIVAKPKLKKAVAPAVVRKRAAPKAKKGSAIALVASPKLPFAPPKNTAAAKASD